ncbi:MAG: phenylalanine--tRNA ligase subunit beta [Kiritimatiellaeota bacterium]|nr:phenylalanine--tRNA ligase subunit beta [Kiritimatiellota bacterium]
MKLSLNWLSDYLDLPCGPLELADKLTMAGIEVEEINEIGGDVPEGIVVVEIIKRSPHPDAGKLSVCQVNTGTETLQVVCGAPNCDAGVKAPLATIGTVLIDSDSGDKLKIKKSKLRGVESYGMLCAADELGLPGGHNGILELPADARVGAPLKSCLDTDTIYELEITPNRPDWLSHWGVARDLSALTRARLRFPDIAVPKFTGTGDAVTVQVRKPSLCPRYTARVIRGAKIAESPEWLKKRLTSIGLRPINNVVDVTNFVLMELGHPLHAFDLDLLEGNGIVVRKPEPGEKMKALDGSELSLSPDNLVICDQVKPVALAGVMGGEHSGVTEKTVNILLESAVFDPSNIRSTSRNLKITSASSYRFERGVDFEMASKASDRAVKLILELAGGKLASELIDVRAEHKPPKPVLCRFDKIRAILGAEVSNEKMLQIFSGLGLKVERSDSASCVLLPPSYRLDIYREADLAEEVARIHGLDNIPPAPLAAISGGDREKDAYYGFETLRDQLARVGLNECVNYSLISIDKALLDARFADITVKKIKNPISLELACLRPSLFPQMLETVERNIARGNRDLRLFELGNVFCADESMFSEERLECAIAITGKAHPERFSAERDVNVDFYDLKGVVKALFEIRRNKCEFHALPTDTKASANFAPGTAAEIVVDGRVVGECGETAPNLVKGMRMTAPLFIAVIQADSLLSGKKRGVKFSQIPQFPSTSRDVAFIADESLEHAEVMKVIGKAKLKNLEKVELFDLFKDEKTLGAGRKSMAYSLTFRASDRTLTDKEVNAAHDKLRARLAETLNVELR